MKTSPRHYLQYVMCSVILCCLSMACQVFAGKLNPSSPNYHLEYRLHFCNSLSKGDFIRIMNLALYSLGQNMNASQIHTRMSYGSQGDTDEANIQTFDYFLQEVGNDTGFYSALNTVLAELMPNLALELTGAAELKSAVYIFGEADNNQTLESAVHMLMTNGYASGDPKVWHIVKWLPLEYSKSACEDPCDDALSEILVKMRQQAIHWGYLVRAVQKAHSALTSDLLQSMGKTQDDYQQFLTEYTAMVGQHGYMTLNQLDGETDFIAKMEATKVTFMISLKTKKADYPDSLSLLEMMKKWLKKDDNPTPKKIMDALTMCNNLRMANSVKTYCDQMGVATTEPLRAR